MAQITLNADDDHVPRILAAIATEQTPNPTVADLKALLMSFIRTKVQNYEREQAATAVLNLS